MSLSLEALLAAAKHEPQEVVLPELGGSVWVRALSAVEGLAMAAQFRSLGPGTDAHLALDRAAISLVTYLCDETGTALASSLEEGRKLMATLRLSTVNRIVDAGQKLNGTGPEAAPEAVASLEKN